MAETHDVAETMTGVEDDLEYGDVATASRRTRARAFGFDPDNPPSTDVHGVKVEISEEAQHALHQLDKIMTELQRDRPEGIPADPTLRSPDRPQGLDIPVTVMETSDFLAAFVAALGGPSGLAWQTMTRGHVLDAQDQLANLRGQYADALDQIERLNRAVEDLTRALRSVRAVV